MKINSYMLTVLMLTTLLTIAHSVSAKEVDTNAMAMERYSISDYEKVEVEISYYTDLACENGKYGSVDARGNKLEHGTIASDRGLPLGKVKYIIDNQVYINNDRGNPKRIRIRKDGVHRIDMFIARNAGESDSEYYKRVNNLGKTKTIALLEIDDEYKERIRELLNQEGEF